MRAGRGSPDLDAGDRVRRERADRDAARGSRNRAPTSRCVPSPRRVGRRRGTGRRVGREGQGARLGVVSRALDQGAGGGGHPRDLRPHRLDPRGGRPARGRRLHRHRAGPAHRARSRRQRHAPRHAVGDGAGARSRREGSDAPVVVRRRLRDRAAGGDQEVRQRRVLLGWRRELQVRRQRPGSWRRRRLLRKLRRRRDHREDQGARARPLRRQRHARQRHHPRRRGGDAEGRQVVHQARLRRRRPRLPAPAGRDGGRQRQGRAGAWQETIAFFKKNLEQ